ncbi:MAG: hypothetical protein KDI43_12075 [Gammaproteobacteria bacterium]|nr:hypothetical protein [Gammaproteobacteria bacterium]
MNELETNEKIGKIESRLLSAYIDRELDEQSRQEVEEILRLDPDALSYVVQAKKLSAMIRMSLDAHLNTTEARTAQKILDDRLKKYREKNITSRARGRNRLLDHPFFAVAASIMLLFIGYLVGSYSLETKLQKQIIALEKEKEISLAAVEGERDRILEYIPSGQTMKWKSDNGLVQAELTPIRTLRMDNEQYCREYREVIMQNEKSESKYGISCRVGKERWRTKLILLNGEFNSM